MIDAPDPRPLLTLLVGDPLVSDDGQPLGSTWRSPWGRLADDLAAAVRRTGVGLWLDVQPATWGRAVECLPRSRFVALLCHGSPQTLSFEADAGARRRVLSVADDLPRLFQGHLPEVVLVLACQGAAAAAAIHAAGVPFTLGIDEQHMLPWDEAVKLGATFFGALGAGQPLSVAAAQAAGATQHAPLFRAFGTGSLSSALPQGDVTTQDLAPWVLRPAKETFVGRERELAALLDELARPGACVQVSGPPGIGKSELTRALLERARLLRWPSAGSLFVVLERARSAADVLNAVRLALGPLGLEAPSARQIGQVLGSVERLVVLDNAEDVLDPGADAAWAALQELLTGAQDAGQARLVLTTRRLLPGLTRAQPRVPLGGLASDAETRRLIEGVVRASWVSTPAGARERWRALVANPRFGELVVALDRYTLAAQLAGRQLASGASVVEVLDALRRRGDVRAPGADEDEAGREESLAASLDLSRRRLAARRPQAVELWALIAEIPGGVPRDLLLDDDDRADLDELLRQGLLEQEGEGAACLAPMRAYLARHAPVLRTERQQRLYVATARALAERFEWLQEHLTGQDSSLAHAGVARWLRAAVYLVTDEAALALWRPVAPEAVGHLAGNTAWCALCSGLPDAALALCRAAAPWTTEDRFRLTHAFVAQHLDRLDEAHAIAEAVLSSSTRPAHQAEAAGLMGDLAVREDRVEDARTIYPQALQAFRATGDRLGEANTLKSLGDLAAREDRVEDARTIYPQALQAFRTIGDRLGEANTLRSLGDLAAREDRLEDARARYVQALHAFRTIGARLGEAHTLRGLAHVALGQARLEDAIILASSAAALADQLDDALGSSGAWRLLGQAQQRAGHSDLALAALLTGRARARAAQSNYNQALLLFTLADVLLALEADEELRALIMLSALVRARRADVRLPDQLRQQAEQLEARGQAEDILRAADAVLDPLTEQYSTPALDDASAPPDTTS